MSMSTDAPEIVTVEVPPDVAREAARMADEQNVAVEDALARLTAFDYPADVVTRAVVTDGGTSGP